MDEQNEKRSRLARDVLRLSWNQILVNLRFLDAALSRLTPVETDAVSFATDGQYPGVRPAARAAGLQGRPGCARAGLSARGAPLRLSAHVRPFPGGSGGVGPGLRHRGGAFHHPAGAPGCRGGAGGSAGGRRISSCKKTWAY